ncbi:MAG: phytanoyl-CoA dioxygenase family protein [Gammaproteobacteria bacterium]
MELTPVENIEFAKQQLDEHGLALLANALSAKQVDDIKQRLAQAIAASEADGVPTRNYAFDPDPHNQRVFHLFNLDQIFIDLIQDSVALEFVRHQLGDAFLISNFSANITEPGNAPMQLHADQGYVPAPWPPMPLACNVAWLLDDFTGENGGTRFVPNSHQLAHGPDPDEIYDVIPIEAPAGTMMIMDGRLWHQTGENRTTDQSRAALFGYYVLRWIRPQMSWNTTLWPETIKKLSPEFLHLLGFYSGNVEYQIPHGARAAAQPPQQLLSDSNDAFVLGSKQ